MCNVRVYLNTWADDLKWRSPVDAYVHVTFLKMCRRTIYYYIFPFDAHKMASINNRQENSLATFSRIQGKRIWSALSQNGKQVVAKLVNTTIHIKLWGSMSTTIPCRCRYC